MKFGHRSFSGEQTYGIHTYSMYQKVGSAARERTCISYLYELIDNDHVRMVAATSIRFERAKLASSFRRAPMRFTKAF